MHVSSVSNGALEERRDNGRIDAAREREQHLVATDFAAHPLDAVVDDRAGSPARRAAADLVHEPAQDACALSGVGDFGVELDAVEAALLVGDARNRRTVGRCDEAESGRRRAHPIPVAHPHVEQSVALGIHLVLDAREQPRVSACADLRIAELPVIGRLDLPPELRRHALHAVADTEYRNPQFE